MQDGFCVAIWLNPALKHQISGRIEGDAVAFGGYGGVGWVASVLVVNHSCHAFHGFHDFLNDIFAQSPLKPENGG